MADDLQPYPVAAGGEVAVVSPSGHGGTVPADKLQDALAMGYRLERPEEHRERRLESEFGDRPIAGAGLGALSALTLGGSDLLGAIDNPDSAVTQIGQRNRGAHFAGEVGGLLTGVGAAGLVGGAGATAAEAVGGGALRQAVARGAAEGAVLGVGETAQHVALSQDPLSAEAVAGDLLKSVLLGGGLGGAGGGLGELASQAAGKARRGLEGLQERLSTRVAAPGEKATLDAARAAEVERLTSAAQPDRAALVDEVRSLRADQKPLREALQTRIASAPDDVRADLLRAERSLAGVVGNARKFGDAPEAALDAVTNYATTLRQALGTEPPALGQRMLDRVADLEARLQKVAGSPSSPALSQIDAQLAEIAKAPLAADVDLRGAKDALAEETDKLRQAQTAARQALGGDAAKVSRAITDATKDLPSLAERVGAAEPELGKRLTSAARELDAAVDGVARNPDRFVEALNRVERHLTEAGTALPTAPPPTTVAWNDFVKDNVKAYTSKYGGGKAAMKQLSKEYQATKAELAKALPAKNNQISDALDDVAKMREKIEGTMVEPTSSKAKALEDRIEELRKPKGLGDEVLERMGTYAKGLGGGLIGNMLGGPIGGLAGAVLGAGRPGVDLFSALVGKGSGLSSKVSTMAAEVGARIAGVASRVAGGAEAAAGPAIRRAAALSPGAFRTVRGAVLDAAADPQGTKARIEDTLAGVRTMDPVLADQLAAIKMRAIAHLAAVSPKSPGGPSLSGVDGAVSRLEQDRFMRRASVAFDVGTLFDALQHGTLTPAQVQTAEAIYPALLGTLRERVLTEIAGKQISPARALSLTFLLGAPATPSLRPESIAAAQARANGEIARAATPPRSAGSQAQPEQPTRVQATAGR